jgi:NADH:ubiquinone oxidoreductase subunit 6 (subunit J)
MQNRIKIGTILITNYWLALGFSTVPQCRFAGTKVRTEMKNCIKIGSILITNYWLVFGFSDVAQCRI